MGVVTQKFSGALCAPDVGTTLSQILNPPLLCVCVCVRERERESVRVRVNSLPTDWLSSSSPLCLLIGWQSMAGVSVRSEGEGGVCSRMSVLICRRANESIEESVVERERRKERER